MTRTFFHLQAIAILALGPAMLAACSTVAAPPSRTLATAALLDAQGADRGRAAILRDGERIEVRLDVSGFPPGSIGAHLHAVGKCESPGFTSAGPHLNPVGHQHGMLNPMGSHLGDLPNIAVGADGKGSLVGALGTGGAEVEAALFDADGSAIVVHAGPDDYRTDPSGNSGARVACGVLVKAP